MKLYQLIIIILICCTFLKHGPNKEVVKYKNETENKLKIIKSEIREIQSDLDNIKELNKIISEIKTILIDNTVYVKDLPQ